MDDSKEGERKGDFATPTLLVSVLATLPGCPVFDKPPQSCCNTHVKACNDAGFLLAKGHTPKQQQMMPQRLRPAERADLPPRRSAALLSHAPTTMPFKYQLPCIMT